MLLRKGKEAVAMFHLDMAIGFVYYKGKVVWQAIRSCFGSGLWKPRKPWVNTEKWKIRKL